MTSDRPTAALFPEPADGGAASLSGPKLGTGVLPYQHIVAMIRAREIISVPEIEPGQIQPSSLDLRLGRYAYRVRASFLPGPHSDVMGKVKEMGGHPLDLALRMGYTEAEKMRRSEDTVEGPRAFAEKRKPSFTGT